MTGASQTVGVARPRFVASHEVSLRQKTLAFLVATAASMFVGHELSNDPTSHPGRVNPGALIQESVDTIQSPNLFEMNGPNNTHTAVSLGKVTLSGTLLSQETPSMVSGTAKIPYEGKGAWITNKGLGYYLGRAQDGDSFDRAIISTSGRFTYGLTTHASNGQQLCGWLETKYIRKSDSDTLDLTNPCRMFFGQLKDGPYSFLKGPNCRPGDCFDGLKVKLVRKCNHDAWADFAPPGFNPLNMSWAATGEGPYTYIGKEKGFKSKKGGRDTFVYYRFTFDKPDSQGRFYAVVRTPTRSWMTIRKSCIKGFPKNRPKTRATP